MVIKCSLPEEGIWVSSFAKINHQATTATSNLNISFWSNEAKTYFQKKWKTNLFFERKKLFDYQFTKQGKHSSMYINVKFIYIYPCAWLSSNLQKKEHYIFTFALVIVPNGENSFRRRSSSIPSSRFFT